MNASGFFIYLCSITKSQHAMNKELKIHAAVVTVKMVTVDGKKMTKATYDQIRDENPFDKKLSLCLEDQVLGYVYDSKLCKEIVLYINNEGELRKTDLYPLYKWATGAEGAREWVRAGLCKSGEYDTMPENEWQRIDKSEKAEGIRSEAKAFWDAILKNQVFIAT